MPTLPSNVTLQPGEETQLWKDISQTPGRLSRYRRLSRLMEKRKRFSGALAILRLALKKIPPDQIGEIRETKKQIARLYEAAGNTRMAVRNYRQLIREYPDTLIFYERLERMYRKQGRGKEMIKIYRTVKKGNPQRERALKRLVRLETDLQNFTSARRDLKLLIAECGPDYARLKDLGRLYEKTGNLRQSIVYYKKALKFKPRNPDLELMIGVSTRKSGLRKKARKTFETILNYSPGWYGSHIQLAEMDIEDGLFDSAEQHLKKIDIRFPGNSRVMINRAHILLKQGHPEEALALCRQGASTTPFYYTDELSLGHQVQAEAHKALGNKEEARYHKLMAERIKGCGDFFKTTIAIADERIAAGNLDMAEKVADGLLARFPMNSLAYIKKAEIARIRGMIDAAISFAERASKENNPRYMNDKIRGLELMAELYGEKGMTDEADRFRRQARELSAVSQ